MFTEPERVHVQWLLVWLALHYGQTEILKLLLLRANFKKSCFFSVSFLSCCFHCFNRCVEFLNWYITRIWLFRYVIRIEYYVFLKKEFFFLIYVEKFILRWPFISIKYLWFVVVKVFSTGIITTSLINARTGTRGRFIKSQDTTTGTCTGLWLTNLLLELIRLVHFILVYGKKNRFSRENWITHMDCGQFTSWSSPIILLTQNLEHQKELVTVEVTSVQVIREKL